jgi:hypothetical protein
MRTTGSSTLSSAATIECSARPKTGEWSRAHGKSIVHATGIPTTATGSSAAATTATAFRTIVTVAFGYDHGFRVGGLPFLVVGGYPRFQYNGYWISAVDPWPEYWGDNWYDNDDVYVAYVDNGYYMYNRRYPHTGVAISISF